jgi:hypothetical protein
MRTKVTIGLAAVFISVAVPAAIFAGTKPDDEFNVVLRDFGYRPLSLPTSDMSVGLLYKIDTRARFFDVVCEITADELAGAVRRARSPEMSAHLQTDRQFDSRIKVDLGGLVDAGGKLGETRTVHFSLNDVTVEWISYEVSIDLFIKMANRPSCERGIADALNNGGYVCQGLKVLEATAEYKLDRNTLGKIDAKAAKEELNNIVKLAVEAQSGTEVVERQGKMQSGKKLKYAVAMKPKCMLPPNGYFDRILPETRWQEWRNYILFNLIEPFWPSQGGAGV